MCSDVCVSPDRWVRHPHVCVYTHRQRIGIVEFTKWLLSHSERSAALEEAKQGPGFCRLGPKLVGPPFQVVCVPLGAQHLRERRASTSMARPEYTLAALPLKSIRQLQVQRARRSQAIAKEAASWNAAADVAAPAQRAALSAALRLRAERGLSAAKVKAAKRASSDSTATSDALIDGFSAPRRERWEVPQSCQAPWAGPVPRSALCQIAPSEESLLRLPREFSNTRYAQRRPSPRLSPRTPRGVLEPIDLGQAANGSEAGASHSATASPLLPAPPVSARPGAAMPVASRLERLASRNRDVQLVRTANHTARPSQMGMRSHRAVEH